MPNEAIVAEAGGMMYMDDGSLPSWSRNSPGAWRLHRTTALRTTTSRPLPIGCSSNLTGASSRSGVAASWRGSQEEHSYFTYKDNCYQYFDGWLTSGWLRRFVQQSSSHSCARCRPGAGHAGSTHDDATGIAMRSLGRCAVSSGRRLRHPESHHDSLMPSSFVDLVCSDQLNSPSSSVGCACGSAV
jgi:hypothetical protein